MSTLIPHDRPSPRTRVRSSRGTDLAFAADLHREHLPLGSLPEVSEHVLRTSRRSWS